MVQCPSCTAGMTEHTVERLYGSSLAIDICRPCAAIWFDGQELLQLAPAATLSLLGEVAKEDAAPRLPMAPTLACPRCRARLLETHDRQRNTPFTYYRCPAGHGKFLTFFQFLRAKNFVRPLDEREITEMRKGIKQVNCVNCGAPVNIERDAACSFCRTPLAIIDPEQVRKAVEDLRKASEVPEAERAALPLTLALERLRTERVFLEAGAAGEADNRRQRLHDALFGEDPLAASLKILEGLLGR